MARILIVDDEETLLYALVLQLRKSGHECLACTTGSAALEALDRFDPEVALFDLNLPDMDGIELVRSVRARGMEAPIVVLTAFGSVTSAVTAIKAGAEEYLQKPVAADDLEIVIRRCLDTSRLREQLDILKREQRRQAGSEVIIGNSAPLRRALAMLEKVAQIPPDTEGLRPTVLLTGETGCGKDLFARRLHELAHGASASAESSGGDSDVPFVQVNCTAVPINLIEDELFGHERGAFTDAHSSKKGLFEFAHAGTIFLDEIGDIPAALQSKLLLVLERRVFRRLGSTAERRVRAQVVAATNRDLDTLVERGDFRKDLYYRLHAFSIRLPPLRERGDDVLLLTRHFLEQHARRLRAQTAELSPAAWNAVRSYAWPGNVRELSNVLQRALLLQEHGRIEPAHLGLATIHAGERSSTHQAQPIDDHAIDVAYALVPDSNPSFWEGDCTLAAVERRLITAALTHTAGNVSEVARLLGISRGALRHRMQRLRIRLHSRVPE